MGLIIGRMAGFNLQFSYTILRSIVKFSDGDDLYNIRRFHSQYIISYSLVDNMTVYSLFVVKF